MRASNRRPRAAPRGCPVCGSELAVTRLGCRECGTEISGEFESCEFCSLTPEDREVLRVFLASRGNMRELERHLNVSYPTARARFDALLGRLSLERVTPPARTGTLETLEALSRGEISVEEALGQV